MAEDKRIIELDPLSVVNGGMKLAIYDPGTDTTFRVDLSVVLPSESADTYTWSSLVTYAIDDIVSYSQTEGAAPELWISTQNNNTGNPPGPASAFWTIAVKATGSAVKYWTAGVYTAQDVSVVYPLDNKYRFWQLNPSVTRPFNSTNLITEFSQAKWLLVGHQNIIKITKNAHAWVAGNWLTIKAGAWALAEVGDVALAKVTNVIDVNNVVVILKTGMIAVTGLVAFTTYYHAAGGGLTIVDNGNPALITISAAEAIIYPGGSGNAILQKSLDTSGAIITLDMENLQQKMFKGSVAIAAAKTWAFSNDGNAKIIPSCRFNITGAFGQTFPAGVKMSDLNFAGGVWTPTDAGEYEMTATKEGTEWYIRIFGPMA